MTTIPMLSKEAASKLPWLTAEQMIEVDRAMIRDYGIMLLQMMEHAGRHLAQLARERFFAGNARGRAIVVLAGKGGNGGGALVCARRLSSWGAEVSVVVTADDGEFGEVPGHQLKILRRLGLAVRRAQGLSPASAGLIVDGIIGYSLHGDPKGEAAELIRWANRSPAPVLSLDVPSGLDASSGVSAEPTIEAAATMTLALPKQGLRVPSAARFVGELYLADIGVPPRLYTLPTLGTQEPDVFLQSDLVRLW